MHKFRMLGSNVWQFVSVDSSMFELEVKGFRVRSEPVGLSAYQQFDEPSQ